MVKLIDAIKERYPDLSEKKIQEVHRDILWQSSLIIAQGQANVIMGFPDTEVVGHETFRM